MIDFKTRMHNSINLLDKVLIQYQKNVLFHNNKLLYEMNRFIGQEQCKKYLGIYKLNENTINVESLIPACIDDNYYKEHFIGCREYIDHLLENANRFETNLYKDVLIDFLYNLFKDEEYRKKIMGVFALNITDEKEHINITHPLMLLDVMFRLGEKLVDDSDKRDSKLKIIVFEYPQEYLEKDTDKDNIDNYVEEMKKVILELTKIKMAAIDAEKEMKKEEVEKIYVSKRLDRIVNTKQSNTAKQRFVIPVDRMASHSVVPFYGWNYVFHQDSNNMVGYPLFNYINLTGNISINTSNNKGGNYCTGSLPKNMEGLNSLKGNNLGSAYRTNCIDITKNYSWIQANLLVSKYLIELYKGLNK